MEGRTSDRERPEEQAWEKLAVERGQDSIVGNGRESGRVWLMPLASSDSR